MSKKHGRDDTPRLMPEDDDELARQMLESAGARLEERLDALGVTVDPVTGADRPHSSKQAAE
jgi:hypothetical protein